MRRLLDAGANGSARNESKQTPYEMVACGPNPHCFCWTSANSCWKSAKTLTSGGLSQCALSLASQHANRWHISLPSWLASHRYSVFCLPHTLTTGILCRSAEPRNPLHGDEEIKGLLQQAAGAA